MKTTNQKKEKIKLSNSVVLYLKEYLSRNNLKMYVNDDILDEIIQNAGAEDGRLALLEENKNLKIDKNFAERSATFVSEIFDEMEKGNIDFEDLNSRLNRNRKNEVKTKKVNPSTVNLITDDVLKKLKIEIPIKEDDIEKLLEYFCDLEELYANGEDENYYGIGCDVLDQICHAVDDFNIRESEKIDLDDLNFQLKEMRK